MERMKHLEKELEKSVGEIIIDLQREIRELEEENNRLKNNAMEDMKEITKLEQENKKLREFKGKREEIMFYFKALVERVEPINSKEAEELQRYKKLFEKLYREELYYLEKENKQLREELEGLKSTYVYDAKQVRDIC